MPGEDYLSHRPRKILIKSVCLINTTVTSQILTILRPKTAVRSTIDITRFAQRQERVFEVRSIIAQSGPGLAFGVFREGGVDSSHRGGGVEIGHVTAEIEEIGGTDIGVPIEFLPGRGGVIHWPADYCRC
jgi:hypothetical protein